MITYDKKRKCSKCGCNYNDKFDGDSGLITRTCSNCTFVQYETTLDAAKKENKIQETDDRELLHG